MKKSKHYAICWKFNSVPNINYVPFVIILWLIFSGMLATYVDSQRTIKINKPPLFELFTITCTALVISIFLIVICNYVFCFITGFYRREIK